ncbi:FtsL-like putative cell division protein [Candidatus Cardinium hertigii]|uniref:Uncharacterized protein n=1 Tax=Candidatus Cardinium hertigii TaxID=247481 RepID=A0A3N2QBE3_9BACT|nr:FtsL-like putative cell division protein [Candidatus Cardinium hertigii]ROT47146.1 hypothetical protein EDM02_04685 [Candidatus Cardinium hertigii]
MLFLLDPSIFFSKSHQEIKKQAICGKICGKSQLCLFTEKGLHPFEKPLYKNWIKMRENIYKPIKKITLFGRLEKILCLNNAFLEKLSTYYLYRLLYLFFLGLLYIWNAHYHEKVLHQINQLQPVVDGLRVKYMRWQSSYIFSSKQSEVAKRAALLGIYESKVPPYRIKIKKSTDPQIKITNIHS